MKRIAQIIIALTMVLVFTTPAYAQDEPGRSLFDRLFAPTTSSRANTERAGIDAQAQVDAAQATADGKARVAEQERMAAEAIARVEADNRLSELDRQIKIAEIEGLRDTLVAEINAGQAVDVATIEGNTAITIAGKAKDNVWAVAFALIAVIVAFTIARNANKAVDIVERRMLEPPKVYKPIEKQDYTLLDAEDYAFITTRESKDHEISI